MKRLPEEDEKVFPVVHSPDEVLSAQVSNNLNIHTVILAAGESKRYGNENKLLEQIKNRPVISHVISAAQGSFTDETIVVTGYEHKRVSSVINSQCHIVLNEEYEQGQSTSVARGISVAQKHNADAVVILLGDMPEVTTRSVNKLVYGYDTTDYTILAAAYNGKRGNPVLFDKKYFDELRDVTGDVGGKDLILSNEDSALVETNSLGVLLDIDTPGEVKGITEISEIK